MGPSIFVTAAMIRALSQRGPVGGSFVYFAGSALCIVITDLLVWYSNTQHDISTGAVIFSLHTFASPSGINVNYDEKQLTGGAGLSCSFYLYRFRKYVYYGFPIINFCNPGVHYETPCICMCVYIYIYAKTPRNISIFRPGCDYFPYQYCNITKIPKTGVATLRPPKRRHFAWQPSARVSQTLQPSFVSQVIATAT